MLARIVEETKSFNPLKNNKIKHFFYHKDFFKPLNSVIIVKIFYDRV